MTKTTISTNKTEENNKFNFKVVLDIKFGGARGHSLVIINSTWLILNIATR